MGHFYACIRYNNCMDGCCVDYRVCDYCNPDELVIQRLATANIVTLFDRSKIIDNLNFLLDHYEYYEDNGLVKITPTVIARRLHTNRQRIYDWLNGIRNPNHQQVLEINTWSDYLRNQQLQWQSQQRQ